MNADSLRSFSLYHLVYPQRLLLAPISRIFMRFGRISYKINSIIFPHINNWHIEEMYLSLKVSTTEAAPRNKVVAAWRSPNESSCIKLELRSIFCRFGVRIYCGVSVGGIKQHSCQLSNRCITWRLIFHIIHKSSSCVLCRRYDIESAIKIIKIQLYMENVYKNVYCHITGKCAQ